MIGGVHVAVQGKGALSVAVVSFVAIWGVDPVLSTIRKKLRSMSNLI